jgi:hypothetical protein
MDGWEIAQRRLRAQRLVGRRLPDPVAVVRHFGAVQAQEYAYALWGVAQRTSGAIAADLRKLVDDGAILRTHALRPTWHFLAPEDLGWVQALTGSRVHAFNAYYYRQHGLDFASAERTNRLIVDALRGGNHLTRKELAEVLAVGGFPVTGNKLAYVVMWAELEGLIANGPMRGKQHTYALVEERVAAPRDLSGDDALAELTRRFFASHGPATIKDFAWWSSLTVTQIKRGLDLVGSALESAEVDGLTVWYDPAAPTDGDTATTAFLLQAYDEYVVAYSNTKFVFNLGRLAANPGQYNENSLVHPIIVDGQMLGSWRRRPDGSGHRVEFELPSTLTAKQRKALVAELARHQSYAETTVAPVHV